MPDSSDWILKIVSGPHQGAEVALRPGRTVVGSQPECDLVLHDVLVAPQHFALVVQADGVSVEPLDGRVFCNGKRVPSAAAVPPFGFVTAGTTHLVIGAANARWPLLSPADAPELEKEPPAPAAQPEPSAAAGAVGESSAGKLARKPPSPEVRRRALWTAGIGGVLLVVWLVLWLRWGPHAPAAPHLSERERAEQLLQGFPDGRAIAFDTQGERLTASGYVESDAAQREIAGAFREQLPEVTLRLWSMPRIVDTARSLLNTRAVNLEASAGAPGEVVVRGRLASRELWTPVRQQLLAEIPGIRSLREEIVFDSETVPPPAADSILHPAPAPANAPAPQHRWDGVSVVALQELGDGQGWLRLSDGSVYFRGATLPDAGRLSGVRDGQATLEAGTNRFRVGVGDDVAAALRTPLPAETTAAAAVEPPPALAQQTTPPNG